jgi:release factor glutamine methyltransferase
MPGISAPAVSRAKLMERGCSILRAAGIDSPRREARLLLAHTLGLAMPDLVRDPHRLADPAAYESVLARRAAREPLAYILGEREFWSLNFAVSPATLIPRPESEILIEAALAAFAGRAPPRRILDLGSGSGCLLLAALHEFSRAFGIGVDRSIAAVRLAAANAAVLGLADRAAFLCADWSSPLCACFDLILCNPPYIPTSAIGGLMPEVACHEPATALDGGPDGLAAYRRVVACLRRLLPRDGVAILELGVGQDAAVAALAATCGMGATTRPDLAGIPRAMVLTRTTV